MVHDGSEPACPRCGAPIDITKRVTDSGWMEQPMIADMTRLRCGDIRCQIAGTLVPAIEFSLAHDDWIYFSHHALLWTDTRCALRRRQVGHLRRPQQQRHPVAQRRGIGGESKGAHLDRPARRGRGPAG